MIKRDFYLNQIIRHMHNGDQSNHRHPPVR